MEPLREELFRPSLEDTSPIEPGFSVRSHFWVAFLGGAVALFIFAMQSARKMGRLAQDRWFFVAFGVITLFTHMVELQFAWEQKDDPDLRRTMRLVQRLIAFLWFGILWLRHRKLHRAADLTGQDRPSPWRAALISLGISLALFVVGLVILATREAL